MPVLSCPEHIRGILVNLASDIAHYKPETPGDFFRLACKERNSLRYGIEIEFSECDGLQEEIKSRSDWEEEFEENFGEWLLLAVPGMTEKLARWFSNNLHGSIETFIDKFTPWHYETVLDEYIQNHKSEDFADVRGWEHSEEGTEGIIREYKTDSPNDFDDTLSLVSDLFDRAGNWEIPDNGSCHVHISVPGMHHNLTETSALHCCILYELSQLQSLFPACLTERFKYSERFFRFDATPGTKFSCVHSHPQGTLEFRLWGAAGSVSDIEWFLKISAAAFLLGYLRFAERRYNPKFLTDSAAVKLFRSQFKSAMLEENPLEEVEITGVPPEESVWGIIGEGIARGGEFPPIVEVHPYSHQYRSFGEFHSGSGEARVVCWSKWINRLNCWYKWIK